MSDQTGSYDELIDLANRATNVGATDLAGILTTMAGEALEAEGKGEGNGSENAE